MLERLEGVYRIKVKPDELTCRGNKQAALRILVGENTSSHVKGLEQQDEKALTVLFPFLPHPPEHKLSGGGGRCLSRVGRVGIQGIFPLPVAPFTVPLDKVQLSRFR